MHFRSAVLLLVTGAALVCPGQVSPVPMTSRPADPAPAIGSNESYEPVNAGDLIYVYITDDPDLTRTYRIAPDGTISLPGVSETLAIAGLAPAAVEQVIARGLLKAKILVNPMVSVNVLEYRSRPVQISGAVKHPLTIQALGNMRLLDALARCDGLDADAGFEILVLRNGSDGVSEPEIHIPVQALLEGLDPQLNIALHGGEQIRVPRAGKIYIVGNVKNPGAFPITEADGLSVLKAVGLCQGLLPFSREDAVIYRLSPGASQRTEITVPVKAILKRRAADVRLRPNDILYVSDFTGRRHTAEVFDRITGVGTAASSALMFKVVP